MIETKIKFSEIAEMLFFAMLIGATHTALEY